MIEVIFQIDCIIHKCARFMGSLRTRVSKKQLQCNRIVCLEYCYGIRTPVLNNECESDSHSQRILSNIAVQIKSTRSSDGSTEKRVSQRRSIWSKGNSRENKSRIQRLATDQPRIQGRSISRAYIRKICGRTSIFFKWLDKSGSTLYRSTS